MIYGVGKPYPTFVEKAVIIEFILGVLQCSEIAPLDGLCPDEPTIDSDWFFLTRCHFFALLLSSWFHD
jgi:hypothetical protein